MKEKVLAAKPPLGWNSFDSYGVYLYEEAAFGTLEAMATKLKPFGYEYFVIDLGWYGEYALIPGTIYPAEKHASDVRLNEFGYPLPSECYFPNGFDTLVDRCQNLGLKFGVHMMRGIPRKAVELDLPIEGTGYTAGDVAVTDPELQCRWCHHNYAMDPEHPGTQAYYDGVIRHLAEMEVDFIKYDDIVPYPQDIEAVARAIDKVDRPIVLSLSPGRLADLEKMAIYRMANMLRVTADVWDDQADIDKSFDAWKAWQGMEQPGFWPDLDMIPFGQLQLMAPQAEDVEKTEDEVRLSGRGRNRWCRLTKPQMETFITQRALAASPLMMGGDLLTLDETSHALITNREMLACNQNGVMGKLIAEEGAIEIWQTPEKDVEDHGWVGIFNRSEDESEIEVTNTTLGLIEAKTYACRDVWGGTTFDLGPEAAQTITLEPHGVLFVRYELA